MTGKIIKGIAGFYYVYTTLGLVECKAKGVFRNKNIKPLVGDNVKISLIDEEQLTGNIDEILERKNSLIRLRETSKLCGRLSMSTTVFSTVSSTNTASTGTLYIIYIRYARGKRPTSTSCSRC